MLAIAISAFITLFRNAWFMFIESGSVTMPLSTRTAISHKVISGRIFLLILLACVMILLFSSFAPISNQPKAVASRKVPVRVSLNGFVQGLHISSLVLKKGVKIMPLGDSITTGDNSYRYGGYRVALWNLGQAAGWRFHFVGSKQSGPAALPDKHNEGHSGWRIDQLSAKVVSWLRAATPDIVLLHIGTNDLRQGYSPEVVLTRLNILIDQITNTVPYAILIVAQITPQVDTTINARVITYNAAIPRLVDLKTKQGKHIEYVDMYDAVPLHDVSDHIHPNNAGYALMAQVWYKALIPIIEG